MRMTNRHYLPKRLALIGSLSMLGITTLICLFVFVVNISGRSTVSDDSVVGYLRGGRIMIIRLPSTTGSQGMISIYANGSVGPPKHGYDSVPAVALPASTWTQVQALHDQWCKKKPVFSALRADEPYYVVGINCAIFNQSEFRVPVNQLPPVLLELVQASSS